MLQRKARQTFHLISNSNTGGLLNVDSLIHVGEIKGGIIQWKTTRELPKEKHPQDRQTKSTTIPSYLKESGVQSHKNMPKLFGYHSTYTCARRRQPNPDPNCGFTMSHKMKYLRFWRLIYYLTRVLTSADAGYIPP